MVNKYSYTPFGVLTSSDETIPQPFTYAGQYGVMQEPGGFYYMRARYYDSDTGRFISEDPIGFSGGINLYAYCNSNPVNFIDPLGLCAGGTNQLTFMQWKSDIYDENDSLKGEITAQAMQFQTKTDYSKASLYIDRASVIGKIGLSGFKVEAAFKVIEATNELKMFDVGGTRVSVYYSGGYGVGVRAVGNYEPGEGGEVGVSLFGGPGGSVSIKWRNAERW